MYQRYAAAQAWKHSVIAWNDGESGGFKEVTLEIKARVAGAGWGWERSGASVYRFT